MDERQFIFNGKLFTATQLQEKYGDNWEAAAQERGIEEAYQYNDKVFSASQLKEKYGDDYRNVAIEKGITPFGEKKNQVETQVPQEDGEYNLGDGSSVSQETEPEIEPESRGFWADAWDNLTANTKSALAGIAGTPSYLHKQLFELIAPEEASEYVNSLEPSQREDFINGIMSMTGAPTTSSIGEIAQSGAEKQEELQKRSNEIRSRMTQYDNTITQALGNGDIGEASRRLGVEGIGVIPSIIQAMIPYVGLTSVAAGSAANKQEQLEEEGADIGIESLSDSALTGIVEGVLEKYTAKQGKKIWQAIAGKGDDVVREGIGGLIDGLKAAGASMIGEGGTEALQATGEKLIDYAIMGKEQDFMEAVYDIADNFLIGAVSGAAMGGTAPVVRSVNNLRKKRGAEPVEGADVELDIPAEEDTDTPDYLKIITRKGVEEVGSEFEQKIAYVQQEVENGTITEEEGKTAEAQLERSKKRAVAQIVLRVDQPTTNQPTIEVKKKGAGKYTDAISGNRIVKNSKGKWQVKDKKGKILHEANTLKAAKSFQEETNREDIIEDMRTPIQKADNLLTKGREQGKSDTEIIESIQDAEIKRTAEIRIRQENDATLSPEQARKRSKQLAEKAREEQAKPEEEFLKKSEKTLMKAMDEFTDRQGSVKRLLRKAGLKGVNDFIVSKLGANAQARRLADRVQSRVFKNLSQEELRDLEEIILNKRIISLDKNRADRGYSLLDHQGGQTSQSARLALEGYREKLGDRKFERLNKRADAYFEEYRGLLQAMRNEGIISQSTYEEFSEVDYSPRKIIKFMSDMEGMFMPEELDGFEASTLSQDAIQSSTTGSKESQVMDARGLIQRSILGRTKAIFANRLNSAFAGELVNSMNELKVIEKKLLEEQELTQEEQKKLPYLRELNRVAKIDRIIGFTPSGNPKYQLEGKTKGYRSLYYMVDGVRHRVLLREDFYTKFTDTGNQILGAAARNGLSIATGTRIVKALATGNNPLFFITNIPRDLAFVLTFSEVYGTNNLNILQNNIVYQGLKLGKDFIKGFYSSISRDKLYDSYFENGGGMDFLTLQGRYGKNDGVFGKYVSRDLSDAFFDLSNTWVARGAGSFMEGLRRLNTASEIATRLAIYERSQKNQLKKLGVDSLSDLSQEQQNQVLSKAIRQAREITDFNQGGKVTKAVDSGIPYLNAATQGTRSAVQNVQERPVETTWRVLQMAGVMGSALTYGAVTLVGYLRDEEDEEYADYSDEEIYFETLKGVSEYDLKNYYIIPTGTRDSKGEWMYYRIAKAQALTPFLVATEHIIRDQIANAADISFEQIPLERKILNTMDENLLPISVNPFNTVSRVPLVDALVAYLGVDSYTGNVLDWQRGEIPVELEGRYNKSVEGFYKKIGESVRVSPVRTKSIVESFVTTPSTNPFVGFGYAAAEYISDSEKTDIAKEFGNAAMRRVMKSTSEYNRTAKLLQNVDDAVVDAYKRHLDVKNAVREAVVKAKNTGNEGELRKVLEETVAVQNPDLMEDAMKWAKSEAESKKFVPIINELRFTRNKEVRAVIIARIFGDALMRSEDKVNFDSREKKILNQLGEAKVIDADVMKYYVKIVNGEKKE